MAGKAKNSSFYSSLILTLSFFLAGLPDAGARQFPFIGFAFQKARDQAPQHSLVRVSIVSKFRGPKDTVEINGKLLKDYSPLIIHSLSATGVVLDQKGNVMTFLGYRWLDIQDRDPAIEVSGEGQKWKGKLVGIDQRNGVAVIRLSGGKLKKTPTCDKCEVKGGTTVLAPASSELSQLRKAQVVSIGAEPERQDTRGWIITVDRPFPDTGQPLLTADHRVLGFIASQDPMGIRNRVYPISQLLASANRILKTGGDVRAGWLGLYVTDSNPVIGPGVLVQQVEPESPAQQAGFFPGDFLIRYDSEPIADSIHFVELVEESAIGSSAKVDILRRGNPLTVTPRIAARKPQAPAFVFPGGLPGLMDVPLGSLVSPAVPKNQRLMIGVETILLDPQLADALEITARQGLLVIDVQRKSPADLAGILVGDVIVSIDGEPIVDGLEFVAFLKTHNWGAQAGLEINRKGTNQTITVRISD